MIGTALVAITALSGTGFGASQASVTVPAVVAGTLSLTDPAAIDASPAPQNGPTWSPSATAVLNLGELTGTETASASLTWRVSTTNPTGFSVTIANVGGSAPLLRSGSNTISDMGPSPAPLDTGATAFGIAAGDPVGHAQGSVNYASTPWGTTGGGGTQGTLYRGIPLGGMTVAQRTAASSNDPFTLTFAVTSNASALPQPGTYSGTARITATAL